MKAIINIPQIKSIVENTIADFDNMLAGDIRIIGLREKIEKRKETFIKVQNIPQ